MDIGNSQSKEDMSEEKSESDGGLLSLEDDYTVIYTSNTPAASEMITSEIQKYRSWDVSNRVDPLKWCGIIATLSQFSLKLAECIWESMPQARRASELVRSVGSWGVGAEKRAPKQDWE
ncbi:hypothetical protein AAMO2058_001347700 [Amorphochlora amoebiformis]